MKLSLFSVFLCINLALSQSTYGNPVLWEDLADLDVFRVGDAFYYSASTMAYSPGAPVLRSYDLVNWEYVGHSVPELDMSQDYYLNGTQAYVQGVWASFLNYRPSNKKFYWGGCIDADKTHIFTSSAAEGPWSKAAVIDTCYYDAGLLVDDDDTMYVAYGKTSIQVAQLSADGLSQVSTQAVYNAAFYVEGSRFYKRNGIYYILVTKPPTGEYVLKSTTGPFGPYEIAKLCDNLPPPTTISGGGNPHQGGIVQTQNDDWYYMGFVDAYPGGRVPVLAPIEWDANDWPVLQLVDSAWAVNYPYPNLTAGGPTTSAGRFLDTFRGPSLGHEWEWNHNPDHTKFSLNNGLILQTATVTTSLYSARNTLTHRILGPASHGTVKLDLSGMTDGDRAGLALFRDASAYVGIKRINGVSTIVMVDGLTMDSNWDTASNGTEQATAALTGETIWLRITADIAPGGTKEASFAYSVDGQTWTDIGPVFTMITDWHFFMGYRFGIFSYATEALGGALRVESFEMVAV